MANNKPFVVKSGLIPQTDNDQDLGGANNKFANAHISNLSGAVQINSAFTLPTADGSTGNVLQTDGAGNITWADLAAVTFSDTAPSTPQSGDLWFDSGTSAELFIWTGTEWISTTGGDQAAFTIREFTGDNTTTVFSTNVGTNVRAFVYLNGVLLQETTDYSFANGDVTFVTAPFTGDVIQVLLHGLAEYFDLSTIGGDTDGITEGSTNLFYTDARVQTKLGNVSGDIIPDTDVAYDIGSATNRFRDIYLSGNSIDLGGVAITSDGISKIQLPQGSTIGGAEAPQVDLNIAPEVLEIQVSAPAAGQATAWLWTWETSSLPYARRQITNSPEVQVPLYKQGTYTVNNYAAYDLFDDMTQTHSLYLKWIDGAGTDNLVSWATSTGPVSDTHPDINGGNPTDVQRINISVPSTITIPTLTAPSVSYTVTNNAAGAYTFSGAAKGDNPNLGPFYRGGTYTFNITATGHPFYFTTDNGTNFSSGTYFGEYTTGVTGSRTDSGTITFTVPNDAPDTLYYQCGNHSVMRGAITVKDLAVETNINGNPVVYFQHTQEGHKTPVELRPIPSLVNQMCLVYDATVNKFVPQDLATYVENTPSFENKIREVAGTAELVVEDGSTVIAKVNVYDDSTYLPLTGNNAGDQAFATDTNILYIWDGSAWQQAGTTNSDDLNEGSTNLFFTNERVDDRVAALLVGGNNITATYDDTAGTLTLDGQPGYTDSDVGTYLSANGYDTATNIVASITDSAPATLDTLNELAAALGDDPNFATTVSTQIGTKFNSADFNSTFDTILATKSTTDLAEGTNLYYTDARADARIALQAGANLDLSGKSTTDLAEGTNLYYTQGRFDSAFATKISSDVTFGADVSADLVNATLLLQDDTIASGETYTIPSGKQVVVDHLDVIGDVDVQGTLATVSGGYLSQTTMKTETIAHTNGTSAITIASDGKVGVANSNPTAGLVVSNGSLQLTSFNNPTTGIGLEAGWDGSKSVLQSYNRDSNSWQQTAYNASAHIFGQGDVRINGSGYQSPSSGNNYLTVGDGNSAGSSGIGIVRGEGLGGGTGPYLDFYHGASSGTVSQHRIYSYSDSGSNSKLYISADHGNDVGTDNSQLHLRTSGFTTNILTKKQNTTYAKRNTTYYQSDYTRSNGNNFGEARYEERTFQLVLETTSNNYYQPVIFFPSNYGDDRIRDNTQPFGQTGNWAGEIDISFYGSQRALDFGGTDTSWASGYLTLEFDFAHWNAKPQYIAIKHYRQVGNKFIGGHYIPGTTSFILLYIWPGSYVIRSRARSGTSVWYPGIDASGHVFNSGSSTGLSFAPFGHGSRDTYWDSSRDWTLL